ncbi:MAG: hypothetical protein LBH59_01310, partial [Planctomycetaceae bacterium]|nr:hypothetical protein [Planctomycetaceae bacterium]
LEQTLHVVALAVFSFLILKRLQHKFFCFGYSTANTFCPTQPNQLAQQNQSRRILYPFRITFKRGEKQK